MKRKSVILAILIFIAAPAIIWAAQKTVTTYTWDSNVDVQPNCINAINPTNVTVGASGSTGSTVAVTTSSSCAWTAVSNNAWITVTGGASGTGNGTVTYNVAANLSGASRVGTITIAGQTFTVNQSGCVYTLNPTSAAHSAGGSTGSTVTVTTTSGCSWTAVSNNTWITVTGGASGTGNGTVTYNVAANPDTSVRSGTINIAGQIFTVNQAGSCVYTLNPTSAAHSAGGSTGSTVTVTTTSGCSWTAVSNNAWITVTGGASGTGNGTVTYNVAANPDTSVRAGTITIAGHTFTVSQAAAVGDCLNIADNFACKVTGYDYVYMKVYLTDSAGAPVADATAVTYSIIRYHQNDTNESGSLNNNGGGWYGGGGTGGNFTSNCGLTTNCRRSNNYFRQTPTVTVTATRGACTIQKSMIVGN
jgi:hypothetical protein